MKSDIPLLPLSWKTDIRWILPLSGFWMGMLPNVVLAADLSAPTEKSSSAWVKITEIEVPERASYQDTPITVSLQRYGSKPIAVFPNESAKSLTATGEDPKWFVATIPLVKQVELDAHLKALKSQVPAESEANPAFTLQFHLSFDNTELRGLIASELTAKRKEAMVLKNGGGKDPVLPITAGLIEPLPDEAIRMCWAKMGASYRLIYCNPDPSLIEKGQAQYITPDPNPSVSVVGTLEELAQFCADPKIVLRSIAGTYTTKRNLVSVTLKDLVSSRFAQDLTGTDKMQNIVSISTSSAGGGGGFSLGPISFGGGTERAKTTTEVKVQRWVTRQHALEVIEQYLSNLETKVWVEFNAEKSTDLKKVAADIMGRLLQKAEARTVHFQSVSGTTLKYADSQNNEVSVLVGRIEGRTLDAKSNLSVDTDSKEEAKVPIEGVPLEGKSEHHLKLKIDNSANATNLGAPIIPTTLELHQISTSLLNGVASESFEEIQAVRSRQVTNVDAIILKETPELFDVGMVLASVLPYELHTEEFRQNWVPCDGRDVVGSHYTKLTGAITAPDLRGQFLRGLNKFVEKMPNGEIGQRTDGKQAPLDLKDPSKPELGTVPERIIGDWQENAFAKHSHPVTPFVLVPNDDWRGGGNRTPGHAYPMDPKAWDKAHPAVGGLETRPNNVSAFFFIKIN